jgi:hypothetical protein
MGKCLKLLGCLGYRALFNFKDDPPSTVEILSYADPVDYEFFKALLGVKELSEKPPKRELTELAKSMLENTTSNFKKNSSQKHQRKRMSTDFIGV